MKVSYTSMTDETAPDLYRFVAVDGRSTPWRKVPKLGVAGMQYHKARLALGEKFNLEMRRADGELTVGSNDGR